MLFYPASEDTYLMEDAIRARHERNVQFIVEVGCGSGYISKVLAEVYPFSQIISTDINPHAIEETSRVCKRLNVTVVQTSIIDSIKENIDMAVFNPPYLPSEKEYLTGEWMDRSWAGGEKGMEITNKFLDETAHIHIRYVLLCQYNNPADVIEKLVSKGYCVEVIKQQKILNENLQIVRIERTETSTK
ncbi:release factor glutamine methyltransferase [Nematocida ausubeli]|nr:release factor glutamine methyltransferase [Nematocida ausubeli]